MAYAPLAQVMAVCGVDPRTPPGNVLLAALIAREDQIATELREYGGVFGLHPEIIDEVLANRVPLGTRLPEEARIRIHQQFIQHINDLRQQGEG